jgi:branched-chain amino acid aminotransferase
MLQDTLTVKVTKTTHSRIEEVDWSNLPFGRIFSDHMLVMDYENGEWQQPEILPFGPIEMHPAMMPFHEYSSLLDISQNVQCYHCYYYY